MNRLFACAVLLLAAFPAIAADANGYTAQYECRAGNPNCDVDVVGLTNRACDQIIGPSTPWSSINWSNNSICIHAGDHTAKGVLVISASGTATTRKVLKYYAPNDSNDDPWTVSSHSPAKLRGIQINGADYWIIHRLTIDGDWTSSNPGINITNNSDADNNVINRVLVQNFDESLVIIGGGGNDNITIQNSVLRNTKPNIAHENQCIALRGNSINKRVINNEIYNCNKGTFAEEGYSPHGGLVLENNDVYLTPDRYTDCNGRYTPNGPCSDTEGVAFDSKGGAPASNIGRIINNRAWGMRPGDKNLAQSGGGWAVSLSNVTDDSPFDGTDYLLIQNNIFGDMDLAIWNYYKGPDHNSIVGNLIHDVYDHGGQVQYSRDRGGVTFKYLSNSEVYLNTFINADPIMDSWGLGTNNDIRCNVFVGGGAATGSYGAGTQVDWNAFYGVSRTTTGTSASNVAYSSISDAKMQSFCYYRKLRTGPEQVCVANARPTTASPHLKACDPSVGSRPDVGISNTYPLL